MAGGDGLPPCLDGIGKVGDLGHVPIEWKGHGVGAAARIAGLADIFLAPIKPFEVEIAAGKRCAGFLEIETDAFGATGEEGRGGHQAAHGAIGEFEAAGNEVLRFHLVETGGRRERGDGLDRAGEAQHQVERMDRLGDEDTAAILGKTAAARLVIVALLRAPPRHDEMGGKEPSELAAGDPFRQRLGGGAEAVLKNDAQRHPCPVTGFDDGGGGGGRAFDGLFHQNVLTGGGSGFD
jgi:hypothetical protein